MGGRGNSGTARDNSGRNVSFKTTEKGYSVTRSDGTKDRIANNIGNIKNEVSRTYDKTTKVTRIVSDFYGSKKKNVYRITKDILPSGTVDVVSIKELKSSK